MADWINSNEITYGPTTGTGDTTAEAVGVKSKSTFSDIFSKLNALRKMRGAVSPNVGDVRSFSGSTYKWEYYNGTTWVPIEGVIPQTNARNSVLSGAVNSTTGLPDIFTASGLALEVLVKSTAVPIILSFADGFDNAYGPVDHIAALTADATMASLPQNSTVYAYADRNASTGAITLGYTAVTPVVSDITPSTVTDTHWYKPSAGKTYVYNGSWQAKQRVFLGVFVSGASAMTSATGYAFNQVKGNFVGSLYGPASANVLSSLLTAAGDVPFATGAGVWSKVAAVPSAHLMLNEAGTALVGIVPYKIGSFTRDLTTASGTQAITGVGFKPSIVLFMAGAASVNHGLGMDDGTSHIMEGEVASTPYVLNSASIYFTDAGQANRQDAHITTLGTDGFTLTWAKNGSPAGTVTIYYLALR